MQFFIRTNILMFFQVVRISHFSHMLKNPIDSKTPNGQRTPKATMRKIGNCSIDKDGRVWPCGKCEGCNIKKCGTCGNCKNPKNIA